MPGPRIAFACIAALAAILGFAAKLHTGPGSVWLTDHVAGFFYVLFWVFVALTAAPGASAGSVALGVFGVTCGLELLQLWRPPFLERIRSGLLGHALIGSTFSWPDFLYYGLAALAAPALARRARRWIAEPRAARRR